MTKEVIHGHHPGLVTTTAQTPGLHMSGTMGENRLTQRHLTVEFQNTWDTHTQMSSKLSESERKNKLFSAIKNRMSPHLSTAAQEASRQWKNTFEEEKLFQPQFLYPAKLPMNYN